MISVDFTDGQNIAFYALKAIIKHSFLIHVIEGKPENLKKA